MLCCQFRSSITDFRPHLVNCRRHANIRIPLSQDQRNGVTLVPGQTFYEGPNDVHTVGRNASTTELAKFIVILLKKKGVDVVLPAE